MTTQLDGDAINAVAALAKDAAEVRTELIGDYQFSVAPLSRVNLDPAQPKPLEFYTLKGLADYLRAGEVFEDRPMVHVVSPTRVDVVGQLIGQDRHLRRHIAVATCKTAEMKGFRFDQFLPVESLNIALQTCFEAGAGELADLRKFCASVRSTAEVGLADDGVSQAVTAKAGIAAVVSAGVKNPWLLAPWRTFTDVAQPLSTYILRFKQGDEPAAALFETGDTSWQVEAVAAIAEHLRGLVGDTYKVLG